jgi:aconitate hydratase
MGVLPLQYKEGDTAQSLGLTGNETYTISGIANDIKPLKEVQVTAVKSDGTQINFNVIARMDSSIEIEYYRHGGILQYVLREFLHKEDDKK